MPAEGKRRLFSSQCFWRETMRDPRVGPFDARLTVILAVTLFYFTVWTLILGVAGIAFFWAIARFRLPLPSAMRFARSWLAGPLRSGQPRAFVRSAIDYGFELRPDLAVAPRLKHWVDADAGRAGDDRPAAKTRRSPFQFAPRLLSSKSHGETSRGSKDSD